MHTERQIKMKELALRHNAERFASMLRNGQLNDINLLMYNIESMNDLVRELRHEQLFISLKHEQLMADAATTNERFMKESHEELDKTTKVKEEPYKNWFMIYDNHKI